MKEENGKKNEARKNARKEGSAKKRKKGGGITVSLAAVLMVIALLFGAAAGYALGRQSMRARLNEAEARIDALTDAYVESERSDDLFEGELNGENEEALLDLAGVVMEEEGNDLLGGDDLLAAETDAAAEPVVVAEFEGGTVMSNEAAQAYEDQLTMYVFDGYSEEEIPVELIDDVLEGLVADKLLYARAQALGLDQLSPEDEQETERMADESFMQIVGLMEGAMQEEGMTEAEAHDAALTYLAENEDITRESTLASIRETYWMDKLFDEMVKDVSVSDADIEAAYAQKLEEQKSGFTASPEEYEFARMGDEVIVYNLSGCRRIRCLLAPMDEAVLDTVVGLNLQIESADEQEAAALKEACDAYYEEPAKAAQAALEALRGGADIESVCAENKLEDTEIFVMEQSLLMPEEVVRAAWALENVGDFSEPVRLDDGVAILIYAGDVTEGEVPLSEAKEAIRAELLPIAQFEAYNAMVNDMVAAANPKYYPERMQ